MYQKLKDWIWVLSVGAVGGVLVVGSICAWSYVRNGNVDTDRLQLPVFLATGLLLMLGGFLLAGGGIGMEQVHLESRPDKTSRGRPDAFGIYFLSCGIWCMALFFAIDRALR